MKSCGSGPGATISSRGLNEAVAGARRLLLHARAPVAVRNAQTRDVKVLARTSGPHLRPGVAISLVGNVYMQEGIVDLDS